MNKIYYLMLSGLFIFTISSYANATHWWNFEHKNGANLGIDLDSYQDLIDDEGQEVTVIRFRYIDSKPKFIINPVLNQTLPAYGMEMLLQARCDTGELKVPEAAFLNQQFKAIWQLKDYPDLLKVNHIAIPFNQYYHDTDMRAFIGVCTYRKMEKEQGISIKDIQVDSEGKFLGIKTMKK